MENARGRTVSCTGEHRSTVQYWRQLRGLSRSNFKEFRQTVTGALTCGSGPIQSACSER